MAAALLALGTAAHAEKLWSVPTERAFSAEALNYWDEWGRPKLQSKKREDWLSEKMVREELLACLNAGSLEPCVGMVIRAWFLLDDERRKAVVPSALEIAERPFEVDLLTVAGDRRLPADQETAVFGLVRLEEIATISETLLGREDPLTVRRRVAVEVANWRAGEIPTGARQWLPRVLDSKSAPEVSAQLRNMEISHVAKNGWTMPETLREAEEVKKRLGALSAANLALIQLAMGLGAAAESSARQGYDAIVAARGANDPRTLAAALVLARVLAERDKGSEALPLARQAFAALKRDPYATNLQKIDAGRRIFGLICRNR